MTTVRTVAPEVRMAAETFELRSVEEDGTYLEGVAAPYMRWVDVGSYDERFAPTVFDTTLSQRPDSVPLMVNHKVSEIAVARPVEWAKSDSELRGIWKFDTRPEAQEVARLAREGILTGLSVHFMAGRKKTDNTVERDADNRPHVTRHHARLLEVSLVSVAAYEGAKVSLVRTAGITELVQVSVADQRAHEIRTQMAGLKARLDALEEAK